MSACPAVKDRSSTRSSKSTERNPTAEQYTMRSEFAEFNALILSKDVTDFILIRQLPLFFGCIYRKRPT